MKKHSTFLLANMAILILMFSCSKKSSSSPTLSLTLGSLTYSAVNTCSWTDANNATHTGTPNNVVFKVSDPSGLLVSHSFQLFEQVASQTPVVVPNPTLSGSSVSFSGCITFGSNSSIPAKYFITTSNGITSNLLLVTYNQPAGAD